MVGQLALSRSGFWKEGEGVMLQITRRRGGSRGIPVPDAHSTGGLGGLSRHLGSSPRDRVCSRDPPGGGLLARVMGGGGAPGG